MHDVYFLSSSYMVLRHYILRSTQCNSLATDAQKLCAVSAAVYIYVYVSDGSLSFPLFHLLFSPVSATSVYLLCYDCASVAVSDSVSVSVLWLTFRFWVLVSVSVSLFLLLLRMVLCCSPRMGRLVVFPQVFCLICSVALLLQRCIKRNILSF
jgi:hypothetical protein